MENFLVIAGLIIGGLIAVLIGLAALFWLCMGAWIAWQLGVVLVIAGGFIAGPWGAVGGLVITGIFGLIIQRAAAS